MDNPTFRQKPDSELLRWIVVCIVITVLLSIVTVKCSTVLAQEPTKETIQVWPSIEFGYEDRDLATFSFIHNRSENHLWLSNLYFINLQLDFSYKGFVVFSDTKTIIKPNNLFSYSPRQIYYTIGAGYKIRQVYIKVEHMCSHGVDARIIREAINRVSVRIDLLKH